MDHESGLSRYPNIALIGCGEWGKNLVRNLANLGALHVISDVDQAKAAALARKFPGLSVVSRDEVLSDPRIAGIVIATPARSHFALAREALSARKDVFVEKPLALSFSEGDELVALAAEQDRILMVGHLLRYHPAIRALKNLLDEGRLGRVYYIYSNRLNLGRFRTEENILWSFAPHDLSAILFLLNESPVRVAAQGGCYLRAGIADVTVSTLEFQSGVKGHIFVNWLHPFKEQKLVIVGDRGMAVFNDLEPENKLLFFPQPVHWVDRLPVPRLQEAEVVPCEKKEPLRIECEHFLECIATRRRPLTDGHEGLRVLRILEACHDSLQKNGATVSVEPESKRYFAHETAVVDEPATIGEGTRIWHFTHIMSHARIGRNCTIGQNVFVGSDVVIGDNVKIQNNVSVYTGVTLEDHVFCGPSVVFTNVFNPRSEVPRKDEYRSTLVRTGATLGANSTVICGHTIGRYAFIGAGALVTKDVADHAVVVGVPGRVVGWMCQCGQRLGFSPSDASPESTASCESCGRSYIRREETVFELTALSQPMRS